MVGLGLILDPELTSILSLSLLLINAFKKYLNFNQQNQKQQQQQNDDGTEDEKYLLETMYYISGLSIPIWLSDTKNYLVLFTGIGHLAVKDFTPWLMQKIDKLGLDSNYSKKLPESEKSILKSILSVGIQVLYYYNDDLLKS
jgi:hypothetical protein